MPSTQVRRYLTVANSRVPVLQATFLTSTAVVNVPCVADRSREDRINEPDTTFMELCSLTAQQTKLGCVCFCARIERGCSANSCQISDGVVIDGVRISVIDIRAVRIKMVVVVGATTSRVGRSVAIISRWAETKVEETVLVEGRPVGGGSLLELVAGVGR